MKGNRALKGVQQVNLGQGETLFICNGLHYAWSFEDGEGVCVVGRKLPNGDFEILERTDETETL